MKHLKYIRQVEILRFAQNDKLYFLRLLKHPLKAILFRVAARSRELTPFRGIAKSSPKSGDRPSLSELVLFYTLFADAYRCG